MLLGMTNLNVPIDDENQWYYCPYCQEDYHLPDNSIECPICGIRDLEILHDVNDGLK